MLSAKFGPTGPDGIYAGLSIAEPKFLLGLITGGSIIFWFAGASMQAVTTGAYQAVDSSRRT